MDRSLSRRLLLATSEGVFQLPAAAMDLPDYVSCAQVRARVQSVPQQAQAGQYRTGQAVSVPVQTRHDTPYQDRSGKDGLHHP